MKGVMLPVIAAMITATAANAIAQQSSNAPPAPIKLEDYAATNDVAKPAGVQFVSLRCASLYLFLSEWLKQENREEMAAKFEEAAKSLFTAALSTGKNQADFVTDQVPRMIAMYSERARSAKAATGNVFEDPILHSDILFCKRIAGR